MFGTTWRNRNVQSIISKVDSGHTTGTRDYVRGLCIAAVSEIVTASVAKQNANGLALKETNKVNQMMSSMTPAGGRWDGELGPKPMK